MKILRNKIKSKKNPEIRDGDFFLDIESTGFRPNKDYIYTVGLVFLNKDEAELVQIFGEGLSEEKLVLKEAMEIIEGYSRVISFNGESFDIPFINKRGKKYGISFPDIESLDIYKEIRLYKDILGLESLKQKAVEKRLGIFRKDEYTGGDCIDFYLSYLKNKDGNLYDKLMLHNFEDLKHMPHILDILDIMQEKLSVEVGGYKFIFKDYNFYGDFIEIKFKYDGGCPIFIDQGFYSKNTYKDELSLKVYIKTAKVSSGKKVKFVDKGMFDGIKEIKFEDENLLANEYVPLKIGSKIYIENMIKLINI